MLYNLSNFDYIDKNYGKEYLWRHVIQSLNKEFEKDEHELEDVIAEIDGKFRTITVLRINDLGDNNCMLEFRILGIEDNRYVIEFIGRIKC